VETDYFTNFFYSGLDMDKGVGYEMDRYEVIPFSEAGKPDQKPHFTVNLIEIFVKHPYLFGVFEADGMELFYLLRFESIVVLKKPNPIGIAAKSTPQLGWVFERYIGPYGDMCGINTRCVKIIGVYELKRVLLPKGLFGKGSGVNHEAQSSNGR